jgi:hypothetical protein
VSDSYTEIAAISEFGILLSAGFLFNNKSILLRCEIDEEEVFEVNLSTINNMFPNNNSTAGLALPLYFDDSKDMVTFKPSTAVMFRKSIKFFAKASTNSNSRDFESGLIEYTRE